MVVISALQANSGLARRNHATRRLAAWDGPLARTGSDADAFNGTLDAQPMKPTGTSATKGRARGDSGRIISTRLLPAAVKKKGEGGGG